MLTANKDLHPGVKLLHNLAYLLLKFGQAQEFVMPFNREIWNVNPLKKLAEEVPIKDP